MTGLKKPDGNVPRFRVLAVLWTLAILAACSIPGSDIPRVDVVNFDKLIHFTLFAVFGWLWMYAVDRPLSRRIATVLLAGVAYAVDTEFYQGLLPWDRSPDPLDALANVLGLSVAVAAAGLRLRTRDATPSL